MSTLLDKPRFHAGPGRWEVTLNGRWLGSVHHIGRTWRAFTTQAHILGDFRTRRAAALALCEHWRAGR